MSKFSRCDGEEEEEQDQEGRRLTRPAIGRNEKIESLESPTPADATMADCYFFLPAFSAALVTLPAVGSFLVTALMTPTATVCLMSRTAKRPRGGYSEKASTHMGLEGAISMMAASPFLMDLGKASNSL